MALPAVAAIAAALTPEVSAIAGVIASTIVLYYKENIHDAVVAVGNAISDGLADAGPAIADAFDSGLAVAGDAAVDDAAAATAVSDWIFGANNAADKDKDKVQVGAAPITNACSDCEPPDYCQKKRALLREYLDELEWRHNEIKIDRHNLKINHYDKANKHPEYGYFLGHFEQIVGKKSAIKNLLHKLHINCPPLSPELKKEVDDALNKVPKP